MEKVDNGVLFTLLLLFGIAFVAEEPERIERWMRAAVAIVFLASYFWVKFIRE